MEYGAGTAGNHSGEEHRYQGSSEAWFLGRKHSRSNNLLFSKAHAHVRLNALSAGLSPGSKKRLEAQAKIGTHSRFVRPCQASALLTWYTSDLWYTSLICAKAKMMDLTGNGNITTAWYMWLILTKYNWYWPALQNCMIRLFFDTESTKCHTE